MENEMHRNYGIISPEAEIEFDLKVANQFAVISQGPYHEK
jgi:hypothetical protein